MRKAPVKSLPPTNQHPAFYRLDAIPVAQPILLKHWREKVSYSTDLLTKVHTELFKPCLWPLKDPGYLSGEGLPSWRN